MKRKRVIPAIVIGLGILVTWFSVSGYRRGRIDFDAIRNEKNPLYAEYGEGYFDGGTQSYIGRGYTVYKMHRILESRESEQDGILGGAKLEWWFPISLFVSDYEDYVYIPGPD